MGKSPEFTRREFGKISLLTLAILGLRACGISQSEIIAQTEKEISTSAPTPLKSLEWGIFTGKGVDEMERIEKVVSRRTDFITEFIGWEDEGLISEETRAYALDNKKKIIVFWEAYNPDKIASEDSKYSCKNISSGKFDKYIKNFSRSLKGKNNDVIVFPFPEPNGDWTPQSLTINNNEGRFIDTYRHVSSFFTDMPNVRLGLALNNQSVPDQSGNGLDDYFPGKKWLQLVGLDGFNFGPPNEEWRSFEDIFNPALETVKRWNMDILISSIGCAPGDKRPQWFEDTFQMIKRNEYPITGINIFGENKAGMGDYKRDWSLDEITLRSLSGFLK